MATQSRFQSLPEAEAEVVRLEGELRKRDAENASRRRDNETLAEQLKTLRGEVETKTKAAEAAEGSAKDLGGQLRAAQLSLEATKAGFGKNADLALRLAPADLKAEGAAEFFKKLATDVPGLAVERQEVAGAIPPGGKGGAPAPGWGQGQVLSDEQMEQGLKAAVAAAPKP